MQTFEIPATDKVRKAKPCARLARIGLTTLEEIAANCGGALAQKLRTGDLACVAPSDKFLSAFEAVAPQSLAWQTVDAVSGGVPNVPAYLSGNPMNMRQRRRTRKEAAPLSIMVDLTSSGGITAQQLEKRGAAILALVRILSAVRPVELWAGCGLCADNHHNAAFAFVHIDSAPLDLARAAFVMTNDGAHRSGFYRYMQRHLSAGGWWPFGIEHTQIRDLVGAEQFVGAIPTSSETLYIPPIVLRERLVDQPVAWLKDMLAKHGGETMTEAA